MQEGPAAFYKGFVSSFSDDSFPGTFACGTLMQLGTLRQCLFDHCDFLMDMAMESYFDRPSISLLEVFLSRTRRLISANHTFT